MAMEVIILNHFLVGANTDEGSVLGSRRLTDEGMAAAGYKRMDMVVGRYLLECEDFHSNLAFKLKVPQDYTSVFTHRLKSINLINAIG